MVGLVRGCRGMRGRGVRDDGGEGSGALNALFYRVTANSLVSGWGVQSSGAEESGVMAADPALPPGRLQEAARAFVATVSLPSALPEFDLLQARPLQHRPFSVLHMCIAADDNVMQVWWASAYLHAQLMTVLTAGVIPSST